MAHRILTHEDLVRVAIMRFEEKRTWDECAADIGVSIRCLRDTRKRPEWKAALQEFTNDIEEQAVPYAISHLVGRIQNNDKDATDAAKSILAAFKAAKLELSGPNGGPVRVASPEQIKQALVREEDSIKRAMNAADDDGG